MNLNYSNFRFIFNKNNDLDLDSDFVNFKLFNFPISMIVPEYFNLS